MRAIVVSEPGGVQNMHMEERPVPEPGPGEVRIRVAYAGLNFFDVLIRSGHYLRRPTYPLVLGGEVSGVIDAVGPDIHHLQLGQGVCALTGSAGGYAQWAVADVEALIPLPREMSLKLAAAYPLQVLTAWGVLNVSARVRQPGEWVLVHAAAGGVGSVLCQLARSAGGLVIGTASSEEKCAHARKHGAQWAVNYTQEDWPQQVRQITGGHGADVICDSVGRSVAAGNMRAIANFGRVVIFGYASGAPKYTMDVLWGRSAGVTTYGLYHHVMQEAITRRSVSETLPRVLNGELKLAIGGIFPLEEAAHAHELLEGRRSMGKLLLEVDGSIRAGA